MKSVENMQKDYGNSSDESRQTVVEAHSDMDSLREWAIEWACHHGIFGNNEDVVVAYATAVDLGYRIGTHNNNITEGKDA